MLHLTSLIGGMLLPTSTTTWYQMKVTDKSREVLIAAFWNFSANQNLLKDSERLFQIREGCSARLFRSVRMTFDLQERSVEALFSMSISTLRRRAREQKRLNAAASERLDRIAAICHLAEQIFESREAVARWMSKPNKALGGSTPILHCVTEIGGKQVRRVLCALEWGAAA
ncbi:MULTISPECIES: type II RES/Xre toxin-antitoxin system antitoxin [unclassified Pseudomonas]|uniref:type II RES/Xre toxin-antitoxin system antitoxin n=1 Tax=unclassified Pseudomonas TaxID=196821 RepID=UPI001CBECBDE|nr:antitoxin Xre/MbcA/ParS toxin-binding domain-containing protein [Pseudomonas sp. GL-B-26]